MTGPDSASSGARRTPLLAVVGHATTGHQAVDVRVVEELLRPGVQNGEDADSRSDVAGIVSQLDDCLSRCLHQQRVAILLIAAQRVSQLLRHGDGDVKVGTGQHLCLARGEPVLRLISMAFGTAPVLAGMVGVDLGAAMIAAPQVSAERFGATGKNVGDGAPVRR